MKGSQPTFSVSQLAELRGLTSNNGISSRITLQQRLVAMFTGGSESDPDAERQLTRLGVQAVDGVTRASSIEVDNPNLSSLATYGGGDIGNSLRESAKIFADNKGVRVIATEMGGWDNHFNQGVIDGSFDRNIGKLATALKAFTDDAKQLNFWDRLVVVVMTEFGRRVEANGTGGTDHSGNPGHQNPGIEAIPKVVRIQSRPACEHLY